MERSSVGTEPYSTAGYAFAFEFASGGTASTTATDFKSFASLPGPWLALEGGGATVSDCIPCSLTAMERSRYCRKRSRMLMLMRQYFWTSFRQRRQVSARCSARRLVRPVPRRMVMVWMQRAEKMLVMLPSSVRDVVFWKGLHRDLQMILSVAEDPLGGHVFGDAGDAAGGFEDDLGARGGRFEAEEAIPMNQNLEMAFLQPWSAKMADQTKVDGGTLLVCEVEEARPDGICTMIRRVLHVFWEARHPGFERGVEILKSVWGGRGH